jgi:hypothetical protein
VTDRAGHDVHFDCVLGRCDTFRAEIYLRATMPSGEPGGSLQGTLTGPECRRATTLPVTARFGPAPGIGSPDTIVARVVLTEPAFWTPELPNCYRLDATVGVAGAEVAPCRRMVGLRRLGARGRSLWLDGRRFVPRGHGGEADVIDLEGFRQAGLTAVLADPPEALLDRCDSEGVALIACLVDTAARPLNAEAASRLIGAWAWHPAVLGACLPLGLPHDQVAAVVAATRSTRGTLLLALAVDGTRPPVAPPAGVDLIVLNLPAGGLPHPAWRLDSPPLPLIACRRDVLAATARSRRQCDALQADLATWATVAGRRPDWDWAGYLVIPGDLV